MSSFSFAQEWPGRGARGHRKHHHHHHHHAHRALAAIAEMRGGPWAEGPGPSAEGPFGGPQGPFGRGEFGGFGPGPRGRGRGPGRGRGRGRARRGDVRLALLRLLAQEPANGYQLMQTIEERSGGHWRPSPGTVYPRLSQLEDEGLIKPVGEDGNRQFEITDAGREHLETRASDPDPWEHQESDFGPMADIGPLVLQIGKAAWQVASVGDEAQRAKASELLTETRRALYRLLAEEEQGQD
jgi:DNA-binding PadR family transcriptional regulator